MTKLEKLQEEYRSCLVYLLKCSPEEDQDVIDKLRRLEDEIQQEQIRVAKRRKR